jgi:hypothetical protein
VERAGLFVQFYIAYLHRAYTPGLYLWFVFGKSVKLFNSRNVLIY